MWHCSSFIKQTHYQFSVLGLLFVSPPNNTWCLASVYRHCLVFQKSLLFSYGPQLFLLNPHMCWRYRRRKTARQVLSVLSDLKSIAHGCKSYKCYPCNLLNPGFFMLFIFYESNWSPLEKDHKLKYESKSIFMNEAPDFTCDEWWDGLKI